MRGRGTGSRTITTGAPSHSSQVGRSLASLSLKVTLSDAVAQSQSLQSYTITVRISQSQVALPQYQSQYQSQSSSLSLNVIQSKSLDHSLTDRASNKPTCATKHKRLEWVSNLNHPLHSATLCPLNFPVPVHAYLHTHTYNTTAGAGIEPGSPAPQPDALPTEPLMFPGQNSPTGDASPRLPATKKALQVRVTDDAVTYSNVITTLQTTTDTGEEEDDGLIENKGEGHQPLSRRGGL